jgi:adenosine kinase
MNFPGEFQDHFHSEKLHQINVSFVMDSLEKQLGGTGTNIAYNIALISNKKPSIHLLGSIGCDGQEFINFFKKNNINAKGVIIDQKLYCSAGSVITDKKNNQIWGFYYGASEKIPYTNFAKLNKKTDLMIISANHKNSFLYFQREAIKHKIDYLYDPGMSLTWIKEIDLKEGVMNCQYLIGNDYEIAMILKRIKKTIKQLNDCGLRIITTLGEEGVRYEEVNKVYKVKPYRVKKLVDPTGAGDAFRGGFVAGLMMNYPIKDCLKLGNVMASFAIEKYGTVNHQPSLAEIKKRLQKITNDK